MTYDWHNRLARNPERFSELSSEEVTYSRTGESDVTLTVNPILKKADELTPETGSIIRVEWQDFALNVTDLGALQLPTVGDKITRNGGERFVVMSQIGDRPPYRFSTGKRTRVIVSTKRDEA